MQSQLIDNNKAFLDIVKQLVAILLKEPSEGDLHTVYLYFDETTIHITEKDIQVYV